MFALTLQLMAAPFRLFVGGPLGDGQQWFSWVHLDDVVGLYQWVLETGAISGPVNVVAPDVRQQRQVAHALGRVLRRPSALRTPAAVLRLVMALPGLETDPALESMCLFSEEVAPALKPSGRGAPAAP